MGKASEDEPVAPPAKVIDELNKEWATIKEKAHKDMDNFKFSRAFDDMYEFLWHRFADFYLEELKDSVRSGNIETLDALEKVYAECLKVIHPFMPFVTEAVWKEFYGDNVSILDK